MQYELEEKHKDYRSILHEELCYLLSIIEVKDNSKKAVTQINWLATSRAVPVNSDSDEYVRVLCKKKVRTGVQPNHKKHGEKNPKHYEVQQYCVIFKKAEIPEQKFISHRSKNCFGKRSD